MDADAVTLGQGNGLEVHHGKTSFETGQLLSWLSKKKEKHSARLYSTKAGVIRVCVKAAVDLMV